MTHQPLPLWPRFYRGPLLLFVLAVFLWPTLSVQAANLRIIDGDTLELNGERIRLDGIDAPENAQTCVSLKGKSYACGKEATRYLKRLSAQGAVTCEGDSHDGYGRRIATCYASGHNLNQAMVESGHALAYRQYSTRYVPEENSAHDGRLGLWAGLFDAPWDYRKRKWTVSSTKAPAGCPIKGNISSRGKIYHAPWSPTYARTRIDESAGERWFCSEAEAIAAGWRAPGS